MFGILEKRTVKFSPKSEQKKIRHNIFNSRGLKNGNLFFHKFQNIADFFWTKNPIWPLSRGEGRLRGDLHVVNQNKAHFLNFFIIFKK